MKKRILSLLLVLIMVLGMFPVSAMASGSGKVYASVSYDGAYLDLTNGSMAYQEVSLSDLQEIDLTEYGLGEYLYDENGDGTYEITALHLVIYTQEILMGLDWNDVNVQGSAGSLFFAGGLFGFGDCNLQYYLNGEYPAVDGWGLTADQIVLKSGDFIDVAGYSSWDFYSDSAFGFHYFLDNEEITHEYAATAGETLTVTLGRGASFMGEGSSMTKVADYTVFYGAAFGEADGTVTTDSEGVAEITFAEAGTYYLWVDGGYGNEYPTAVVSSPGYAEVTVEAPACAHETWNDATCKAPKTCANCGETEGEADPEAHSYVGGTCEYCGAAEPAATPSYTIKLSEAEELTAGLNYFISVPAEVLGKDIIFDFGSGTIKGAMCQRHCSKRDIWTAGEGSTMLIAADKVAAHLCNESQRAKVASDFNLYLTEGSQMFAFYWWTSANMNGSYIYIEILPVEEECTHETWTPATCTTPKTCADCGETEGEADPEAHSYVNGTCEHCGEAEPAATPSYTIKLSEAEELTAGLNYFISVPAEVLGKDIIFDFGSGTIKGAMCQRHCSKRDIWTAGEGSTMLIAADKVAAHLCNESQRAKVASDFNLYLTEGSQMFAFYWWTSANMNGSYIYIEILPVEEECTHETWTPATCTTPKTCANCGATEGEADPEAHSYVNGTCEYCGAAKVEAVPFSQTIETPSNGSKVWGYVSSLELSGTDGSVKEYRWASESDPFVLNVVLGEDTDLDATITAKFAITYANDRYVPTLSGEDTVRLENGKGSITVTAVSGKPKSYPDTTWTVKLTVFDPNQTYDVTLPTNNVGFSVRATSSPTVTAGGEFSFKLNIYGDYKKGENFKVLANGVELTSSGDTYTITNITANQTVTVEGVVEKTLAEKNVTVNAPAGSVVSSGAFHSYFKYDFVEPLQISTLEDGRVQYIVPATSGAGGFIRVQNPNGVTYWDFGDLAIGKVFNITEEMLFIGNTEYTKDTVFANYEKNGHDTASLYLTANAQGWLDMDTGDTHSLNVFRNWIPVSNSTTNTGVSLPDVTYTVVDVNGNASDVVTVTPDANNSCYADIKAVKAGTAIVLVSYDAVYNADGEGGKQFSAIWPENTGVIVVTVDAEDANIQTNITVNEEANAGGKQILDVEHDILFYVGDEGAQYSFKPEDGCTVTISRSTVGNEMTFNGFTNEGVTVSEDGTVTLSGLTTGAHIVKVEKDGKTAYQVIRAREVNYKLTHSDGTEVTAENPAQPGETITVQFSRLIDPMGKLSGVYNAKYGFRYVDEVGTVISIGSTSAYGEYYFGSNPARQRFGVTVPAQWDSETYTLTDGGLSLGGWGSTFGAHRYTTYMEGKEPNLNASGTAGVASVLPDVVIPVYVESIPEPTTYAVTLPTGTGCTVAAAESSTSPVNEGGSFSFTVTINDGYEAGENFAVKANDVTLTAVDGVYTIENITADQTISVEGVTEKQAEPAPAWRDVMNKTETCLTALAENKAPIVSSTNGEWLVLGLARNGMSADNEIFKNYYDNVLRHVEENIDAETGRIDKNRATENARVILALTALGKDVTNVAGYNLLQGLSDTDFVKKQGINGPVWALIALDSHNYEIPTNADSSKQVTRAWLVDYILDHQLPGGGWKIQGQSADDMTPMAVQALAPYYDSDPEVKAAVDKALTIMEGMVETGSPETQAQIITARAAMGLDSADALARMLNFALEDGSFRKSPFAAGANQMSTEQAFYAMVAYDRFLNNKTALYDMSDVVIEKPAEQDKPVEKVTLNSSELSLEVGETHTLVALVSPAGATDRTVSWSSSNTSAAAVSTTGVVTAVAEGSAIITAAAGGKTASCIVTVTKASSSEPKLEFGLTEDEIVGYVTISFEDNGIRKSAEVSEIESEYRSPLGTIIGKTRVPFTTGDTIASVTLRLLDELDFTAQYEGNEYSGFYLEAIGNFTAKGHFHRTFGEFDAGRDSGWMITWNDWFIDQGASEFMVEDGDVVAWQYTCQLGADIGDDDWMDNSGGIGADTTTEDRAAAREVKGLIEAIGTVTRDSGAAIKAARSAYDALTGAQKDLVPNYDVLVAAEKKYAELTKDEKVFADVSADAYYYEAVKWAVEMGITKGTGDTTFSPGASCTRAQMVTFLWRAAGEPKAKSATCVFTDVDKDAYYYEALLWAVENGITNGTSDTTFSPDADCNRGQMATFLYRSAKTPVVSGNHAFNDVKADAFCNDAVIWAAARGITNGTSNTTFSPDADCTRGQMVTFLYRYLGKSAISE